MTQVLLVKIEHDASRCPAEDPVRAERIIQPLRQAEPTGVFIPARHKGIVLFPADANHDEVRHTLAVLLPEHHDPVLKVVDATDQVERWLDDGDLLEGTPAQEALLSFASPHFPDSELTEPIGNDELITKSLRQLPDYIAQKVGLTTDLS